MVAYLLLVNISRMFSSMPGLAGGIARDIRDGTLKKYLIQPLDMIGYLLSYRMAHKVAYIVTSFLPYAGLFARVLEFLRSHSGCTDDRRLRHLAPLGVSHRVFL